MPKPRIVHPSRSDVPTHGVLTHDGHIAGGDAQPVRHPRRHHAAPEAGRIDPFERSQNVVVVPADHLDRGRVGQERADRHAPFDLVRSKNSERVPVTGLHNSFNRPAIGLAAAGDMIHATGSAMRMR